MVNGSFHYLCVVINLFSRKVVGWSLFKRHDVDLTIKAFEKAYFDRCEPDYVLFHSDQGSEYTSFIFCQTLEKYNAVQSFSKKGYPYNNACCESFFRQFHIIFLSICPSKQRFAFSSNTHPFTLTLTI